MASDLIHISEPTATTYPGHSEDYSTILKQSGLNYKVEDPFLLVGLPVRTQGWIIHLSIVIWQVNDLVELLVPALKEENVPFKIPMSKEVVTSILNGNMGPYQLCKIVTIYPEDDVQALYLAKKLIALTTSFEGPRIPTDACLENIVYTRYGSINPILIEEPNGKKAKYIYDHAGELVRDSYAIPFKIPANITWPFSEITTPVAYSIKKVLNDKYKPVFYLKNDTKGNVFLALYLKGFILPRYCVIKQGNKNMLSEDSGRTIKDRLAWQKELYQNLSHDIPMPKILDLFEEDGDTYLAMEYVKGQSLYDRVKQLTFNVKSWFSLTPSGRVELIDYLLEIATIIDRLHKKGYIHRDVAPGNFMITKKGNLILIDLELAYCENDQYPDPPFEYGTHGFMSPNQQFMQTPTKVDDIYGFGAVMLTLLTGLSPTKFNIYLQEQLYTNLQFFIGDPAMAALISSCLNRLAELRPDIRTITQNLTLLKKKAGTVRDLITTSGQNINATQLRSLIQAAIKGITKEPMVMQNDLWYSQYNTVESAGAHTQIEYIRYTGLYEGMGGAMYVLARVKNAGFETGSAAYSYKKSLEYIKETFLSRCPEVIAGLYHGAAGIAVVLSEGLKNGLIEDSSTTRTHIQNCLTLPISGYSISAGAAGLGISLIQCIGNIDAEVYNSGMDAVLTGILNAQKEDGSWDLSAENEGNPTKRRLSFGHGIPGILWFLLEYELRYPSVPVRRSAEKGLSWLLQETNSLKGLHDKEKFKKIIRNNDEIGDERKGIYLTLIKGYEVLKRDEYKTLVEKALLNYPKLIIKNDFTQDSGLAGLGELYLEAFRVFKTREWQERADWITSLFIHTFYWVDKDYGFWMMEERNDPTADLMIGTTGIIHYLLRYYNPAATGYRILQ